MGSHLDAVLGRNVSVKRHGQDESDLPVSYWRKHVCDVLELMIPPLVEAWHMPGKDFLTDHTAIVDARIASTKIRY
jgi:hypothetical protein